jgi:signal transduction histidine kinase
VRASDFFGRAAVRRGWVEALWAVFAFANLAAMLVWPAWLRLPFFLVWVGLTLVYGFRLWSPAATATVTVVLAAAIVGVVLTVGLRGDALWGKLVALPLLAAMFMVMAWHARRRAAAEREARATAEMRGRLLERQRQFIDDASHELRTPLTIMRGHLELLDRERPGSDALAVALDELARMERMTERMLLLAAANEPDFLSLREIEIDDFLEQLFMRWAESAQRAWRLDLDLAGSVRLDPAAIRAALDALLENAVGHTQPGDAITLRAYAAAGEIVLEVADEGEGIRADVLETIFSRFARTDDSRTRAAGGVGLGLAIVDAIATGHGGRCTAAARERGAVFALRLPGEGHAESAPASAVRAAGRPGEAAPPHEPAPLPRNA